MDGWQNEYDIQSSYHVQRVITPNDLIKIDRWIDRERERKRERDDDDNDDVDDDDVVDDDDDDDVL